MNWPGLITHYKSFLPVTDKTPALNASRRKHTVSPSL